MSVYDDMYGCIEGALSTDTCDYSVYSEMCELIAEAEAESDKLTEQCKRLFDKTLELGTDNAKLRELGIEVG